MRFSVVTAMHAQRAGAHVLQGRRGQPEMHLHVAAEQRVEHLGVALERHVHQIGAGHGLEHLGGEMRRGAGARRRIVDAARLRLGVGDELLEVGHRQRRVHHQHQRDRGQLGDRREILDRVVGRLLQAGVDRERDGGDQQGVAVGRGLGHDGGADRAAAARPVVDHGGLAPVVVHALRDQPRDRVGGAAGDERHDQVDLLAGIGLRRAAEISAQAINAAAAGIRQPQTHLAPCFSRRVGTLDSRRTRLLRHHRLPGLVEDVGRRGVHFPDRGLQLLAADRIDVELDARRLGLQLGIPHRRHEGRAQRVDALLAAPPARPHRAARRWSGCRSDRESASAPRSWRNRGSADALLVELGIALRVLLRQHLDLALLEPGRIGRRHARPALAAAALHLAALHRQIDLPRAGIAGHDLELGAEQVLEQFGEVAGRCAVRRGADDQLLLEHLGEALHRRAGAHQADIDVLVGVADVVELAHVVGGAGAAAEQRLDHRAHEQRADHRAVLRRGVVDVRGGDVARRARHVADDHVRVAGQVLADVPRDGAGIEIVAAAGRRGGDDSDGLAAVELRDGLLRRGALRAEQGDAATAHAMRKAARWQSGRFMAFRDVKSSRPSLVFDTIARQDRASRRGKLAPSLIRPFRSWMSAMAARCAMPARARCGRGRCATIASPGFPPSPGRWCRCSTRLARRWLTRSQSPYVEEIAGDRRGARLSRHLVPQRLLSMELHRAGARGGRRALAGAHARLAVSRARPPCRDRAHARAGRRVLQRHLAGLCRRADRDGAGPLCRGDQPGAAAGGATTQPLAAALRHRRQCDRHAISACAPSRPTNCCARCSRPAATMARPGRVLERTPIARPVIYTLAGCRPGERCVIERTEDRARHAHRGAPARPTTGCDASPLWEGRVGSAELFTRTYEEAARKQPRPARGAGGMARRVRPRQLRLGRAAGAQQVHPARRRDVRRRAASCARSATSWRTAQEIASAGDAAVRGEGGDGGGLEQARHLALRRGQRRPLARHCGAVRGVAARQRRLDLLDQRQRGLPRNLDRDALAPAVGLADEVDAQRMVERRMVGMVVIDVGGVDPHPAARSLGAAGHRGLFDDVGAHDRSPARPSGREVLVEEREHFLPAVGGLLRRDRRGRARS